MWAYKQGAYKRHINVSERQDKMYLRNELKLTIKNFDFCKQTQKHRCGKLRSGGSLYLREPYIQNNIFVSK